MLEQILNKTRQYIKSIPKDERKKYGQFFTSLESAKFMVNLFDIPNNQSISILDPGAGSGILSAALIEHMQDMQIKQIDLTCYENDSNIIPILKDNLDYIKQKSQITLNYKILEKNYITSQSDDFNGILTFAEESKKYDLVIGNPPYLKIAKDAPEAKAMPAICYGAPNLYFIFASMSLFNLKDNGEMVYIIPRSWTSGAYFKHFRKYLLTNGRLEHIHLFSSRNKVFEEENVLQETIIIKLKKSTTYAKTIDITTSYSNSDFNKISYFKACYNDVVAGKDMYVYLASGKEDLDTLKKLKKFDKTLPDIGLRMKTGLTVDFRNKDLLRNEPSEDAIPIFYSQHIKNGQVIFPINKEYEYLYSGQSGLVQDNKNYLFVKRFTAKEEKRRLQCGVYLSSMLPEYNKISTQNKINFIDKIMGELSEVTVYGLYVLFNSALYDKYYRILNGSTQVNSTEINNMPIPELKTIEKLGNLLRKTCDFSEDNCNKILESVL